MPISAVREITRLELPPIRDGVVQNQFPRLNGPNLDFAGEETQYATHGIHPYVAAINPPLARALLNHYVPAGASVLDPFCGGGGVLVECLLSGRNAVGYDVNPLAVAISRGKTRHVAAAALMRELQDIILDVKADEKKAKEVPEVIRFWYYDYVLEWLAPLAARIHDVRNAAVRDLFRVALSATARDTMLTYRGEVRLRKLRPEDQVRFKPNVIDAFRRRAELAIHRASGLPNGAEIGVVHADCRSIEGQRFHTVVTSPPYGDDKNGVGYFQFSRNMLYFLGFDLDELKLDREKFLGCGDSQVPEGWNVSESLRRILEPIAQNSKKLHHEALQFYYDYYNALKRLTEVTDHRIIVVTGDRTLARTFIDNGHITKEMLENLGWPLEHYYSREIKKKRIANLGTDGGGISLEHVLVHRRP